MSPLRDALRIAGLVGAAWLPFALYFAAYRPGVMTFDSLDQWRQVVDGRWVDNQPVLHTAMVWIGAQLGGPTLVVLAQSLLLAAGIVSVARALVGLGADRRAVTVAAALCVLNPAVGLFSVCLWKDVPFTGAVLFLTAALARAIGSPANVRRYLIEATLWGLLVAALRQNGVAISATALAAAGLLVPTARKPAAVGTASVLLFFALTRAVSVPVLGLEPMPAIARLGTVVHEIAAVVHHRPQSVERADWEVLQQIAPPQHWHGGYDCLSSHPLQSERFDSAALEGNAEAVVQIWSRLARREPSVILGHRLCVSRIAWSPTHRTGSWFFTATRGIEVNDLGLKLDPVSWGLHRALNRVVAWTEGPGRLNLFWRAPLWTSAAFILVGVIAWRRSPRYLVLLAPIVGQQLSILLYNTAQDARYMAASGICAVLLLALAAPRGYDPCSVVRVWFESRLAPHS